MAAFLDISHLRFLAVSIAVHILTFLILYPARPVRVGEPETIPVSILETPEKREPAMTRIPKSPARPARKPPVIAKKNSPLPRAKAQAAAPAQTGENDEFARVEPPPPAPPKPAPAARERVPEQSVVAERPLPTVKELLPPLTWSADSRGNAPVSLNTKDPVYVSYFTKIKQLIESQWEYPELALRYGLQGRLFLEFTIDADGQLERLRLVRSSGSQLLDQEALRAIKAAAPFPPIPRWIKPNPLSISAAMEYHDNRLNYKFAR
jgi:protein TonB